MSAISFNPVYLEQNMGHGIARRASLEHSRNELVALMDSDDISLRERFALQLQRFLANPRLGICGGQITEFADRPEDIIDSRIVPTSHERIVTYLKHRCPMNQVSVMFKKDDVQRAGGYQDWYCNEDYYLWIRMMLQGSIFENTQEALVNVRVGNDMAARRGGWKYFRSEAKLQSYMLKEGIISPARWAYNVGLRFGGEVLLNDSLRKKAFSMFRASAGTHDVQNNKKASDPAGIDNMQSNNTDTEKPDYPPFSVAMCVYGKDNPEWFDTALHSVIDQTVQPDEIVLVVDGPIPESIQSVIDKYTRICSGSLSGYYPETKIEPDVNTTYSGVRQHITPDDVYAGG